MPSVNTSIVKLIDSFNFMVIELIESVIKEIPNDCLITAYHEAVKQMIQNNPSNLMSLFVIYVYQNDVYRHNIMAQNDMFFMNNEDLGKLQFKQYWLRLSAETKDYIKNIMSTFISASELYIELKSEIVTTHALVRKK